MFKVINKWKEKLLDTNKGNNLINFKFLNSKNLELIYPSFQSIVEWITNGELVKFFDIDKTFEEYENQYSISFDEKTKLLLSEVENGNVKLKKQTVLAINKKLSTKNALTNLYKSNTNFLQEKGINILYLAIGFLKWKDTNLNENFVSPLLLLPLSINKDNLSKSFTVEQYEDEIVTNPTLLYKLKQEFNINLPEFRDEKFENESIEEYFARLQIFASQNNWGLLQKCFISCFSFLKINMYKDLEENETKVISNKLVQKLANKDDGDYIQEPAYIEKSNLELTLHSVVDADSSQMEAIAKAMQGDSFVLQGPPGTGKSQTITNLIAEYLYNGKKVLFVSEKLAALKVVYKNLEKVGLNNYCLELHSNKTNKKEVVASLYKELSSSKIDLSSSVDTHQQKYISAKQKLDYFSSLIHTKIEALNQSLYDIFNILTDLDNLPELDYVIEDINNKTIQDLNKTCSLINDYVTFTETIGYNYKDNDFYGLNIQKLNYNEKLSLKKLIATTLAEFELLSEAVVNINQLIGLDILSVNNLNNAIDLLNYIANIKYFDASFMSVQKLNSILQNVQVAKELFDKIALDEKVVLQKYNKNVFENNIDEMYSSFTNEYKSIFRIFKSSYKKDKNILKFCLANPQTKMSYKSMLEDISLCKKIVDNKRLFEMEKEKIKSQLFDKNNIVYTDNISNLLLELQGLSKLLNFDFESLATKNTAEFLDLQEQLKNILEKININNENINLLQNNFDINIINFNNDNIKNIIDKLAKIQGNFEYIDNYIKFNNLFNILKENNIIAFIDLLIKNNYLIGDFVNLYKKAFYTQFVYNYISNNEQVNDFTFEKQRALVNTFIDEDKINFDISQAKLRHQLALSRPTNINISTNGQVATLMREAHKKSHLKPVHKLLSEICELAQILKPCFLMSPLSVSTYLQQNSCEFDVVIFDEASQIFPWDAIGSIYRANQVIIVGDPKQMPPTNFFNANVFNDEVDADEDTTDTLNFESILDLALSTFDTISLKWHYRSKTEELIAFSNKHFYNGDLVTFPTAKKSDDLGVDFYYVPNGIYDRKTNQNYIEAQKVVDLVFEHFDKYPDKSLGVVAFSISQQSFIEDLINEKRQKQKKYEKFFDLSQEEPFFVKNLETVQGDERDVIIFSVAYAKDKNGKFIHNFGPLNKQGGERRLNVAITRAKYNIKLVASIQSTDIDLSKTEMTGSFLLKEYLNYAENNGKNIQIIYDKDLEANQIQQSVIKVLKENNYEVDCNLGFSSFKIPIAIKLPDAQDYFMAIDFDFNRQDKTTRERERLRKENCERMGWHYLKIWALDWTLNNNMCVNRLLKTVKANIDKPVSKKEQKKVSFLVEHKQVEQELIDNKLFEEYKMFDADAYCAKKRLAKTFDNIIEPLIECEQPITEKYLLKRLTQIFPGEKITDNFVYGFYCAIDQHPKVIRHNDYYCLDKNIATPLRVPNNLAFKRDIEEISLYELSLGLYSIIKECVGVDKTGLFKTLIKQLGYHILSERMAERLTKALEILLENKSVVFEDNEYRISTNF